MLFLAIESKCATYGIRTQQAMLCVLQMLENTAAHPTLFSMQDDVMILIATSS